MANGDGALSAYNLAILSPTALSPNHSHMLAHSPEAHAQAHAAALAAVQVRVTTSRGFLLLCYRISNAHRGWNLEKQ